MSQTPRMAAYDIDRPLQVRLKHVAGQVRVTTSDSSTCRVTLTAHSASGQRLVDSVDLQFDASSSRAVLEIRIGGEKFTDGNAQISILWGAFKFPSSAPIDVLLEVPEGTNLDIKTVSGDVECGEAHIGSLDFSSTSGHLECASVHGPAQLKSVSGSLECGSIYGPLRAKNVSGSVRTEAVHGPIEIESVSGSIATCIAVPAPVTTKTVSGDVVISVVPDLPVAVDAKSLSGKLRSTIALEPEAPEWRSMFGGAVQWQGSSEAPTPPASTEPGVSIAAKSVSGDILIQSLASA